jgi:hypothetical protein
MKKRKITLYLLEFKQSSAKLAIPKINEVVSLAKI